MLWTAFTLGLLGSFHCIGMCGPIALALPVGGNSLAERVAAAFSYNSGRVLTYSLFGVLFGIIGKTFALAGWQQVFSITIGVLIVLSILLPGVLSSGTKITGFAYGFTSRIKSGMKDFFQQRTFSSFFFIGMLNGLLPCGLVYLAVAGASATSGPAEGATYMALFGAGTLPVMLSVIVAGNFISVNIRNHIRKAMPYVILLIGVLFILRGLNLDIPYISPKISKTQVHSCH
jgi:sulfite exporter TauE/SafE